MFGLLALVTLSPGLRADGTIVDSPSRRSPVDLSPRADGNVTYETVAKPVGAVLAELSGKLGMKLKATAEANQEIVLVSVHDVPVKGLMDRLATVTSCDWEQDGDTYTLKASNSMRTKERDFAISEAAKKISGELANRVKEQQKLAEATKKAAEKGAKGDQPDKSDDETDALAAMPGPFGMGGPDADVITALLQEIDPAELAEIGPDERGVWVTNNPNRMQRLLGSTAPTLIQDWIVKHNASVPKTEPAASEQETQLPPALQNMFGSMTKPVKEPVAKALLSVQRGLMSSALGLQVELKAYSAQGTVLLTATSMLDTANFEAQIQAAVAKQKGGKVETPPASPAISYSADSQALQSVLSSASKSGGLSVKLPPALREKLIHPEIKDPLAYTVSDCLLSYAKVRSKQIVADVPDTALESSTMTGISGAPQTIADVQKSIDKGDVLRMVEDGDFVLFQPTDPEVARENHVDRLALRKLLSAIETKFVPSLDDVAEYAVSSPAPMDNAVSMEYVMMFVPSMMGSMILNGGQSNWDALRFFGSLEPAQRQILRSGGSFAMGNLPQAPQQFAARFLFSGQAKFTQEGSTPKQEDPFGSMISMFMGGGAGGDFLEEPTEVMPGGLTAAAIVGCGATTEPLVYFSNDGTFGQWTMGPQELAMFTMLQGFISKAGAGSGPDLSMPKNGLLGQRGRLRLTFHVGGKMIASCVLLDPSVSKDASSVALDNLPSDFKSQVASQTALMQKGILGSIGSLMPGKQNTP